MKCFSCGNPPGKAGEGQTAFYSAKGGLLESGPCEGHFIHICDSCLTEGGRQGRVHRSVTENRPPNIYEYTWNPDGDDKPYRYPPPVISRFLEESSSCGS